MSATSVTGPVRNYVVRSKTPSNSEKVLLYLRGMEREEPENPLLDDPELEGSSQPAEHSGTGDDLPFKHPLSPRTQPTDPGRRATVESAGSHITYTDAGRPHDAQSRAFGGSRAPSRTVPIQVVSPTPHVPMPNPKHISDQSWGNMGPLPGTEQARGTFGPVDVSMAWGSHQPMFNAPQPAQYAFSAAGYPLPASTAGYPPQPSNAGFASVHGSMAPSQPLPGATIINLTIQAPTDPHASNSGSRAPSAAPQSVIQSPQPSHSPAPDPPRSRPTTPMQRMPSRSPSPAQATPKAEPLISFDEPSSPQGRAPSAHPSQMPLPVSPRSTFTNNWGWEEPAGPPVPSKAPSHAPSARPQQSVAPSRAAPSMAPSMWAQLAQAGQPAPSGRGGSIAPSHGWQASPSAAPSQRPQGSVAPSQRPSASAAPNARPPASAAPSQRPSRSTAPSQRPSGSIAPSHHPPASAAPSHHPPPASASPSARPPPSAAPSARPGPSNAPSQYHHQKSPSGGSQFGAGSRVTQLHPLSKLPTSPQSAHSRVISPVPPAPRSSAYQAMSARGSKVDGGGGVDGYERSVVHRPASPEQDEDFLDEAETEIVHELLTRTPRTSYTATPSVLAAEVNRSRHHDEDLCVLLHAADDQYTHEVVKRAVRKAIRARLKKLGMKADNDAIRAYREVHNFEYHPTDPTPVIVQAPAPRDDAPPSWAQDLLATMQITKARLDDLDKKLAQQRRDEGTDDGQSVETARPDETDRRASVTEGTESYDAEHDLHGHYAGGQSPLIPGETELDGTERMTYNHHVGSIHHHDGSHMAPESRRPRDDELDTIGDALRTIGGQTPPTQDGQGGARHALRHFMQSDQGSLGDQVYEEELYKLRVNPPRTDATHQTWDLTHADPAEVMPEIPDSDMGHVQGREMYFDDARGASPVPPLPHKDVEQQPGAHNQVWHPPSPAPWQKIHQRLLDWAMVWPMSEFDKALNSTTRGHQVDEIALSIWTTQTYKRYVRMKVTENPPGVVDKMFVPPIVADAISSAVFSGRHSEASAMLRDLWTPFGLEGTPRLIIALSKNRRRENHWVVHRFDLTESTLSTYDTSIEKGVPDSRPLGWWFAIGAAFPGGPAPKSGHLYQNHVRMPRPLQYIIDNSVAAAAIWRNLLMSAKAERAIDLERLRDLVNMEVRNLRQRKEMGKLTAHVVPQTWEQLTGPIS